MQRLELERAALLRDSEGMKDCCSTLSSQLQQVQEQWRAACMANACLQQEVSELREHRKVGAEHVLLISKDLFISV